MLLMDPCNKPANRPEQVLCSLFKQQIKRMRRKKSRHKSTGTRRLRRKTKSSKNWKELEGRGREE